MTSEAEFLSAYERIKSSYKGVMEQIEVAVACEEQERPLEAIAAYEGCVERIEAAFALPVGLPEDVDVVSTQWTDACQLIQKLKSANTEMTYRLNVLRARHAPIDVVAEGGDATEQQQLSPLHDNPCTHYDIHTVSGTQKIYREIIGGLRKLMATQDTGVVFDTLFQAQGNLYKIHPDGVVTAISGSTTISIVMCTVDGEWSYLNGICFIQSSMEKTPALSSAVDSINKLIWLYPLIPTVTACYRTEYGAIILPDLESELAGTAFGIMLIASNEAAASSTGNDAVEIEDEELSDKQMFLLDLLEAVLDGTVEERKQPTRCAAGSQQVSQRIVCAADFISRQLVWGAEKTGQLMVKSTPYFMARIRPAEPDTPPVSSALQSSVEVARSVTGVAVGVTGWVASKVGAASVAVGRFLSPHIQTQGANVLQKGFGYDCTEANDTMEGALTIAAGAVEGVSTVYNGLETSAKILGRNLSENTVKIIEHKYGPSAGNVAAGTFDTIGNAFNVSQNVNYMTPKGIAKKMVKNTGKAVVADYQRTLHSADTHIVPAGLLYPDFRGRKEN